MFFRRRENAFRKAFSLALIFLIGGLPIDLQAQTEIAVNKTNEEKKFVASEREAIKPIVASILPTYFNARNGLTPAELIDRALQSNGELVAVRIEIEKARARLVQARSRPNPTLELEQSSGRLFGSGDGEFSIGASLPLEFYRRRRSRIELAEIEIRAREAEAANFERRVAGEVLLNYAEALAVLREIEVLEMILELDLQTTRFVQIRVNEGETAPLELNLLQVEVERLRSKRELAEGRLQPALTKLKLLTNSPFDAPLLLREQMTTAVLPQLPPTIEIAVDAALRTRPDIQLAQIEEDLATAGLRLVRANGKADFTAYTRYTQGRSVIDLPTGAFPQRDRFLTFGVAIGLPVLNKNQGAKTEAELAIKQARTRREFTEKLVRAEVVAAFQKYEAARRAIATLEMSVLPRSAQNLDVFQRVYEIGEIRITDLIAEQRRLLDANRDLTEALTERYRANAEILVALGTISFK